MRNVGRFLRRLQMLQKRLLCKVSFWLVLCLIPLSVLGMRMVAGQDSGVLHVVLCAEDAQDTLSEKILADLTAKDGLLRFSVCDDAEKAERQVREGRADAAWIFPANLQDRVNAYAAGREGEICRVIERETTVTLRLSHEILYAELYPHVCYALYTAYVTAEVDPDADAEVLRTIYDAQPDGEGLMRFETVSGAPVAEGGDYLLLPLRGLLSLCVLLCAFAAAATFLSERADGVYAAFPAAERLYMLLGSVLVAALDAGVAMLFALAFTGNTVSAGREIAGTVVLVLTSAFFAAALALLAGTAERLCAVLPPLLLAVGAVSPIFFRLEALRPVQMLFPPFYYLYGVYDGKYLLQGLLYGAILLALVLLADRVFGKKRI